MIHGKYPPRPVDYALGPVLPDPPDRQPAEPSKADVAARYAASFRAGANPPPSSPGRQSSLTAQTPAEASAALAGPPPPSAAGPSEIGALSVAQQFNDRPTLHAVVSDTLSEAIKSLYPTLTFDLAKTSVAIPLSSNPPTYRLTPLLDVALNYLTSRSEPDFTDRHTLACTLIDQATGHTLKLAPSEGKPVPAIDMQDIELAIRGLSATVKNSFAQALVRYFTSNAYSAHSPDNGDTNRWLWLSETLRDTLRTAALKQPGLTDPQRETLDQVVTYPDRAQRQRANGADAAKVFILDAGARHAGANAWHLSPDLLITREIAGRTQVLHATSAGVVTAYDSLQAFGEAWGRTLEKAFVFESLNWKRQEPDANIFDTQAAVILNTMVENLGSIQVPRAGTPDELAQLFAQASDPSPWFIGAYAPDTPTLERLREKLPGWLNQASQAERDTYRHHSLALASSVQRNKGRTFLDGVPDIRTYAQQQLDLELAGKGYTAQDVDVVFKVAVGNLGSGYIERVKMSLVDMALDNLAGLPKGQMEVHLRGQPVSDAHMPQLLKDLIEKVDVGGQYPQLLKRELLSDTQPAHDRAARFIEQVPIQMAMQALELKLKGESGITAQGYRFIEAVTQPGAGSKHVEGQEITVRPLAFLRKPGATPDQVDNMFLIEPLASTRGPHVLYRPQMKPALLEFASREALLEAIRQPGALQDSVLAWLPDDKTRAVYSNGGFHTPHIARYSVFNEFDPPTTPEPTTLAVDGYAGATTLRQDLLGGDLMKHWFHSNANSLVTLAQGQSTSDAQSRWASHKELGWLLFNTLLPVLRGPGAMAGWLLQLVSIEDDIKRLATPNDPDPSAAMVDLLINLSMTLAHVPVSEPGEAAHPLEHFKQEPNAGAPGPLPRDGSEPVVHRAVIRQDPAPTTYGSFGDTTAVDIRFSSPRGSTPALQAHIDSFNVPAPKNPGVPIADGLKKGLYQVGDKVYANIENRWFRAATDLDGPHIIDEKNKARTAPSIKRDAQGKWGFDLAPKLRGGMQEPESRKEMTRQNRQAKAHATAEYRRKYLECMNVSEQHKTELGKITTQLAEYETARKKLKTLRNLADTAPDRFAKAYAQQRQHTETLRADLDKQLQDLKPLTQSLVDASRKVVETIAPKKIAGIDDISEFQRDRSLEYRYTLKVLGEIDNLYDTLANDTRAHGVSGASIAQLEQEANNGSRQAHDELMAAIKMLYRNNEEQVASTQAYSRVFDQWLNDSAFGKKEATQYLALVFNKPLANKLLITRLNRLSYLKLLSTTWSARTEAFEHYQMRRLVTDNLKAEFLSFADLRNYNGYTLSEQSAALTTIVTKYEQVLSDSLLMQEEHPEFFNAEYNRLFTEDIKQLITDAQTELAQVVKEQQFLIPPPIRSERPSKPHKQRVFKTEHNKTLIGKLRDPVPGENVNIIDVIDPQSDKPIESYLEHPGERGWVKLTRGEPAQPPRVSPPKSLANYRLEARSLMEGAAGIEETIIFQKRKLADPLRRDTVNPRDWNDMLETQANQLRETANQAEASHGDKPETAELVARWRTAAEEMLEKAHRHAADGYMVQPPTAENVDFLWRHGFVDLNLVKRDVPTKTGDVFTEYAVRRKNQTDVLWYAHFHYPNKGAPRADYTAAHLKIPSQRTKTQKDLIAEAGNNGIVEQIIRSRITAPLDERLFLKL